MGFAGSVQIDRTDRVAIQLGHDTKTVGVGECYRYYCYYEVGSHDIVDLDVEMIQGLTGLVSPSRDRRYIATPLQEDKGDEKEAGKFHQMSHRDSMYDESCIAA